MRAVRYRPPEITGVIDYGERPPRETSGPGAWKIEPTQPVHFTRANPRTPAPAGVGGSLKVASANVDNFFATVADKACRMDDAPRAVPPPIAAAPAAPLNSSASARSSSPSWRRSMPTSSA